MLGGAEQSEASEFRAEQWAGGLNWDELLDPAKGGPGDPPGREEAVKAALELSEKKRRQRGLGKKR